MTVAGPVGRVLLGLAGATVVVAVVASALRTIVLPRGLPSRLTRVVFLVFEALLRLVTRHAGYRRTDAVYASLGPVSLLLLLVAWLSLVLGGFTAVVEAVRPGPLGGAVALSGSSLVTLGVVPAPGALAAVSVVEAGVGLTLLALLIGYLPTLYGAFARREAAVAALALRTGVPLDGARLLDRSWQLDHLQTLAVVFDRWTDVFLDLAESHVSFPVLSWFRSPQPWQSWITAAGAVLDGAALVLSTVLPGQEDAAVTRARVVGAALCLEAGVQSLHRVAQSLGVPGSSPGAELLLTRTAFDAALAQLRRAGLPLRDPDAAWRDFTTRRADYESALVALAAYLVAPPSPWSTDLASGARHRPPVLRLGVTLTHPISSRHPLPADLVQHLSRRPDGGRDPVVGEDATRDAGTGER